MSETVHAPEPFTNARVRRLVIALALAFFLVIAIFASDVPVADDYAVLDFVNRFVDARSPWEALDCILAQHNEHRILTCKLMFLASVGVLGSVKFRVICVVSALYYLGVHRLLAANRGARARIDPRVTLFIACMVFQFGSAESLLWAMTASSNPLVILGALAAFQFGERDGAAALVGCVAFSLLALATQGNGIVVPVLCVLQLGMRRRWLEAGVLGLVGALAMFLYFWGFHFPAHHSDPARAVENVGTIGLFALTMLGCAFGIGSSHHPTLTHLMMVPSCVLGLGILCVTVLAFRRARGGSPGALAYFLVFLVASTILTGIGRHTFGFNHAMVSRYHMYSTFALVAAFLLALEMVPDARFERLRTGRFMRALPWLSLAYVPLSFVMVIYFHFYQYDPARFGGVLYGDAAYAHRVLDDARERGVFPGLP